MVNNFLKLLADFAKGIVKYFIGVLWTAIKQS